MSAAVARDAVGDMKHALRDSLRLGIFLALPATIGLVTFATPIVTVLFERGAFTRSATLLTASILSAYALGLVFYIANRILAPAFYAMRDTWAPMATGMVSVGVNIAASLVLMGHLGAVGLGVATAVASASNCAQLVYRLRRRVGVLGGGRSSEPGDASRSHALPWRSGGLAPNSGGTPWRFPPSWAEPGSWRSSGCGGHPLRRRCAGRPVRRAGLGWTSSDGGRGDRARQIVVDARPNGMLKNSFYRTRPLGPGTGRPGGSRHERKPTERDPSAGGG